MNLKTQARHFLTFLAGLGTLFLGWNIIAPDEVDAVNKAGGDLIEPLLIIIGAVGACLFRAAMAWGSRWFTGLMERMANKSSGGMSGGANLLILGTMAAAVGIALPSCSTFSGHLRIIDPHTGAKGGLKFTPGQPVQGKLKFPAIKIKTAGPVALPQGMRRASDPEPVKPPAITYAECKKQDGHRYGPWFKQSQMYYLPEQPAHVCTVCGSFQNAGGRFMQLVSGKEMPGGCGTLSEVEANAQLNKELLKDFGSWEKYKAAKARDGYGGFTEQD